MRKGKILLPIMIVAIGGFSVFYITQRLEQENVAPEESEAAELGCDTLDPPVKIISKDVPGILTPNEQATARYVIQNCSGEAWFPYDAQSQSGFNFGSNAPRDNVLWGRNRFPLSKRVQPGEKTSIEMQIKAPDSYGAKIFQWGIVHENVEWLRPYLEPDIIFIEKYHSCNGLKNVRDTVQDAAPVLQGCIEAAPNYSIIQIPQGVYTLHSQIWISKPITLVTEGLVDSDKTCGLQERNCAVLKAAPDFPAQLTTDERYSSLIVIRNRDFTRVENIHLKNLVIDGNRVNRPVDTFCTQQQSGKSRLHNIDASLRSGSFFYNEFRNAGCGTALGLWGDRNVVVGNWSHDNGDSNLSGNRLPWSDGASITGDNLQIMGNRFENNTDLDLVLWGTANTDVSLNDFRVTRSDVRAFGSIGLVTSRDFPANESFKDGHISYNTIHCNYRCGFGITIGSWSWDQRADILLDGNIHHNQIDRALQGISTEGAGTTSHPVSIEYNEISNSGGFNTGCGWKTGFINVNPRDIIVFQDGVLPDTSKAWRCQLPSCVFQNNYCDVPEVVPIPSSTTVNTTTRSTIIPNSSPKIDDTSNVCTRFKYSDWGVCLNGTQQRKVTNAYPNGCSGGNPVTSRSCGSCARYDLNSDGYVGILEFAQIARHYNQICDQSCQTFDENGNSTIDETDLFNFKHCYEKAA